MAEILHISEAEWQVMRIIWSDAPVTSTHIIKELSKSIDWTSATIKTLLGRLVNKKAISFEKQNRTFYYFPLVTEEDCIREENKLLIQKIYGGTLNKETQHFLFFGSHPESYIDKLVESLESSYQRVLNNLQYHLPEKITVYIHSDIKRFHAAVGISDGNGWFRASYQNGILHIAPPQYSPDLFAEKVIIHVLSQIVIHKINFDVPLWLYQGVSAYEGKWLDRNWIRISLANKIRNNEIPSFAEISSPLFGHFSENDTYSLGYTIAEFIIQKYGYEKLSQLIREPEDLNKVFGISEDELWNRWVEFLKENYL